VKWEKPDWRAELASTNTTLASIAKIPERAKDGYILAAHSQTHGKGRLGRNWCSQPGLDLTFSFLLKGAITFRHLASLPMAVSLAVAETLQDYGITANTKWPNDLLVVEHKICGILAERITQDSIVVGVGLNVNMDLESAKLISRPATSIFIETGINYDVEHVLDKLLFNMSIWVDRWRADGFLSVKDPWINRCLHMGKMVSVGESKEKEGEVVGLGDVGQLLIRQSTGEVLEVWAGDLNQTTFNS
tara:strand:+ start:64 stop:801 length:738 start_codon:yes stop_codon:yes gene_type:complete